MATPIDLRSDTVTRPGPDMRRAMAAAVVGDDVYGEDPTVRALEERAAVIVGHPSALFVPTGTMGNQIAIQLHTQPGCDVLVEQDSHVYRYELGAMAAWSGALARVIVGDGGRITPEQIDERIAPDVYYMSPTRLLVLENTHNHAGGTVLDLEQSSRLVARARHHRLALHLDGARLFNAAAALGVDAERLAAGFDTVMFSLSKGLGAPVGSVLCGTTESMRRARVIRKRLGGGMRQAGILAAAGLFALEHNLDRLVEDHVRARRLADALAEHPDFRIDPAGVQTNIVVAGLREPASTDRVLRRLAQAGVLAGAMGPGRIRFVTHLDVDDRGLSRAIDVVARLRSD